MERGTERAVRNGVGTRMAKQDQELHSGGAATETADVVIIGGGIMGVSLARGLALRGVRKVLLLERGTLASGASGRTGALLRQHYSNLPEASLAHLSLQTFRSWADEIGGDCGFVNTGCIVTVSTSGEDAVNIERMRQVIAMQQSIGMRTQVISAAELQQLQPFTSVDDIAVAAYEPEAGFVDSLAATRSMAEAAQRAGATIREHSAVLALRRDGDRVTGVETADGVIATDTVVVAAGPWSNRLVAPLGLDLPVEAQRVQVTVLARPLSMPLDGTMTYVDTAAGFFCRNWGHNRTLAGVGGGEFHDVVDPDDWDERSDAGFGQRVLPYLARRMPAMAQATPLYGHAGLYDMTPDTHPILGPVDGLPGLQLMVGFSGAGFKKGPAIGACLAEQIVDGRSATVDLTPFRLARFEGNWQEPWSAWEYHFTTDFGHKF